MKVGVVVNRDGLTQSIILTTIKEKAAFNPLAP